MFEVKFFWVVTPCGVVVRAQRFGWPCCLHLLALPPDVCNGGILPQHHTASQSRGPRLQIFTAVRALKLVTKLSSTIMCILSRGHRPSNQSIPGAVSPVVNRPGREADRSPQSRAEVKNAESYNSIPQNVFMPWFLIKKWTRFYAAVLSSAQGKLYLYPTLLIKTAEKKYFTTTTIRQIFYPQHITKLWTQNMPSIFRP
jgi:hypothetical protein